MGDDDAAVGDFGRDLAQPRADVFIGEPVEAVAPHALVVERARQAVGVGDEGMAAMEGGVETADLRRVGKQRARGARPRRDCAAGATAPAARALRARRRRVVDAAPARRTSGRRGRCGGRPRRPRARDRRARPPPARRSSAAGVAALAVAERALDRRRPAPGGSAACALGRRAARSRRARASASSSASNSANLSEDEPALRVSRISVIGAFPGGSDAIAARRIVMRFLVTGAAGFIGFHLCRRLLARRP